MLVASLVTILLFFGPTIIIGTPYNYYQQDPCTQLPIPSMEQPWDFNVPQIPSVPNNLINPESGSGSKPPLPGCGPQCPPPCCRPCCDPCCPPCYQQDITVKESYKKKEKKTSDADSTKFFTALFSIPGLIADSIMNGQIVI